MWLAGLLAIGMLGAGGGLIGPNSDGQPHVSMASSALSGSPGTLHPIDESAAPGFRAPCSGADLGAGPCDDVPPFDLAANRPAPAPTSTFLTRSSPGHGRQERAPPWRTNDIPRLHST
jgi:hypothetical protein